MRSSGRKSPEQGNVLRAEGGRGDGDEAAPRGSTDGLPERRSGSVQVLCGVGSQSSEA